MKWLLALFIMAIVGLAGTYSHIINLQEIITSQDSKIFELQTENNELMDKYDSEYMDEIKRWMPYNATQVTVIKCIQRNYRLTEKVSG